MPTAASGGMGAPRTPPPVLRLLDGELLRFALRPLRLRFGYAEKQEMVCGRGEAGDGAALATIGGVAALSPRWLTQCSCWAALATIGGVAALSPRWLTQ
jgi:hypothetical protein